MSDLQPIVLSSDDEATIHRLKKARIQADKADMLDAADAQAKRALKQLLSQKSKKKSKKAVLSESSESSSEEDEEEDDEDEDSDEPARKKKKVKRVKKNREAPIPSKYFWEARPAFHHLVMCEGCRQKSMSTAPKATKNGHKYVLHLCDGDILANRRISQNVFFNVPK